MKIIIRVKMSTIDIKQLILVSILISTITAENDYHLCGHRWSDNGDFYTSPDDVVQPIKIRKNSKQSDLLITDNRDSSKLYVATSIIPTLSTGLFNTELPGMINEGDFCSDSKRNIVADMDGDHFDDLLCEKNDGSFTVRYYKRNRFTPEESFAKDFNCDGQTIKIIIGDFDGNHANDILCYNGNNPNLDSSPVYLSQVYNCKHRHSSRGQSRRDHYGYDNIYHRGGHSDCKKDLPLITALSAGVGPSCKPDESRSQIFTLDANGDGKDDIGCFQSVDTVTTYLSKGSSINLFSSTGITAGACTFGQTETIIPADIDGDGDDDLICANNAFRDKIHLKIAFFTAGSYLPFDDTKTTACSPSAFCSADPGGAETAYFFVGDYNGDGKDDLMCRINIGGSAGVRQTRIVFSEYYP